MEPGKEGILDVHYTMDDIFKEVISIYFSPFNQNYQYTYIGNFNPID